MRKTSFRARLACIGLLSAALAACGGGGGSSGGSGNGPVTPVNRAPTANFTYTCVDLACSFTSTSTDQDVGDAVVTYNWSYGDGTAVDQRNAPTHAFSVAGNYAVSLSVGDRSGMTGSVTRQLAVTVPPVPAAPHAAFTATCASLDCTFTDTTIYDAGSTLVTRAWDFGDGSASGSTSPVTHRYPATALTTYSARLTVTDNAGKTSSSTQTVVAAPPASSLNCTGGNCVLALSQTARVTATIVSRECGARNNQVILTSPVRETVFADGCFDAVGVPVSLNSGAAFVAGTTLQFDVVSGSTASLPLLFSPAVRVSGNFASGWTLTFDDGYGGPGEPDFNDLVVLIKPTP